MNVRKPVIYLAAQYHLKNAIAVHGDELRDLGFRVASTWPSEPHDGAVSILTVDTETLAEYAIRDLIEIDEADLLIFFSVHPDEMTRRGGRHVEFGYAMARGKQIAVVGSRENIFHHLQSIAVFANWNQLVEELIDCEFHVPVSDE